MNRGRLIQAFIARIRLFAFGPAILPLAVATSVAQAATTTSIPDGDVAALVAALEAAEDGDTIELAEDGVYTLTETNNRIQGPNGLPVIRHEITIEGRGATIERASGAPHFRVFFLDGAGPRTAIRNVTIKRGSLPSSIGGTGGLGGGIYLYNSSPAIDNCAFTMNRAEVGGGAVANVYNGNPTFSDCVFDANLAGDFGGAIASLSRTRSTITNSVFTGNVSHRDGGGVYLFESDSTITNCTFEDNWALVGGGLANDASGPAVTGCVFRGNWAEYGAGIANMNTSKPAVTASLFEANRGKWGGGMFNEASSPTLSQCDFAGNFAREGEDGFGGGGGIANTNNSNPIVDECTFTGNDADWVRGGGIYNENSSPTINKTTFQRNWAESGGALYNLNSHPAVTDSRFENNNADHHGGAITNASGSHPTIVTTVFSRNGVNDYGGAIYNVGGSSTFVDCTFTGNIADDGGAIANRYQSAVLLENCVLKSNQGWFDGGGIYNENSTTSVTGCVFELNDASVGSGGGIFHDPASSSEIGSTVFCENEPDHIAGTWTDRGGNQFSDACGQSTEGTYEGWVQDNFDEPDRSDDAISGALANPSGDGIPNLLKYGLGLDPRENHAAAMPPPEVRPIPAEGGEDFLTLSFSHPSGLNDIDYEAQLSSDLINWSELALLISSEDDGSITTRTYRDTTPYPASERRFIRLQVTRP